MSTISAVTAISAVTDRSPMRPNDATFGTRAVSGGAAVSCGVIGAGLAYKFALAAMLPAGVTPWLALHLVSVIPAVPLGAVVLFRRKGDRAHRLLGRVWVMLMMMAALSSFGLHGVTGGFSWIHLLSLLVLVALPRAIWKAARGDIVGHRRGMRAVYFGLLAAGAFAFVPGRLLGHWLLG